MDLATANESLLGRSTVALAEALESSGISDQWMQQAAAAVLSHAAAELIAHEQAAGRPLTCQEAIAFLCRGAEGRA